MQRNIIIQQIFADLHRPEYLTIDPLYVVRRFRGHPDQEWIALVSALFAFGGVKQIIKSVENVLERLKMSHEAPSRICEWLKYEEDALERELNSRLKGFKHRIYDGTDVAALIVLYLNFFRRYGSLENHFLHHYHVEHPNVGFALSGVIEDYRGAARLLSFKPGDYFDHLFNSPADGGACKRWLMYLKWMIREDDGIDLGLWKREAGLASKLVIPMDTHLFRISKKLRLTKLKSANWKSAVEATERLKKIDATDPTKFDFSLCRWGMLNPKRRRYGLRPNS